MTAGPSTRTWAAATVLSDYLACENDVGYGCDCCPGRMQAYDALARLAAVCDAAENVCVRAANAPWSREHYRINELRAALNGARNKDTAK